MARDQQLKDPTFGVKPAKIGMSWSGYLVARNERDTQAFEFASELVARGWVNKRSRSWLKKHKAPHAA